MSRIQVWEDRLWRVTTSVAGEVLGFSFLEPKRHIPGVTELDGEEARTFGETLARVTRVLKEVAGAELVYVYVFGGGIPHLHVHLAPHRTGDALNEQMIRGEVGEVKLPSGATVFVSKDYPQIPQEQHRRLAEDVRSRLASIA